MNVLICIPDEKICKLCQSRLQEIQKKDQPEMKVTVSKRNEMLFYLDELESIDLVYLGEGTPDADGMGLAELLRKHGVEADIVFFSNNTERVTSAFDVDALHFLEPTKVDAKKFEEVYEKAKRRSESRNSALISFSCAGENRQVKISNIKYFEVCNRIITVHYLDSTHSCDTAFAFYSTLAKIEDQLSGYGFLRVNRGTLVAKKYIEATTQTEVELTDGSSLQLGRQYIDSVHKLFERG